MDTVHQGDRDGVKGLYLINLVDEVTRYEFVGAVVGISERLLVPLLEGLLLSFPFPILGFHADNGSEYINHRVAGLLDKLRVERFTKSRARRSNDNAPVEGKNANAVRKWFGRDHIPQRFAPEVNRFAQGVPSPFLNFHRPCLFATERRDGNGRIRRKYFARDIMTPYARLRSLAARQGWRPRTCPPWTARADRPLKPPSNVSGRHPRPQRGSLRGGQGCASPVGTPRGHRPKPPARSSPTAIAKIRPRSRVPSALDRRSARKPKPLDQRRRHPQHPALRGRASSQVRILNFPGFLRDQVRTAPAYRQR